MYRFKRNIKMTTLFSYNHVAEFISFISGCRVTLENPIKIIKVEDIASLYDSRF